MLPQIAKALIYQNERFMLQLRDDLLRWFTGLEAQQNDRVASHVSQHLPFNMFT